MILAEFLTEVIGPAHAKLLANNAKGNFTYVSFLWYRGQPATGEVVVFRFSKGASPSQFEDYALSQEFVAIDGPYKTQKAAKLSTAAIS